MRSPLALQSALCLLLLICAARASAQCECIWGGPFTAVQGGTDLVISGKVISGRGNSLDMRVSQVIRGEEFQQPIRIWLRSGDLCRPEPKLFPSDSQWVMALHRIEEVDPGGFNPNTPSISFGRVGDYSLSSCGGYWLSLHGNVVTGNLAGGTRWEQDPKMSPVLLELVVDYVHGRIDAEALLEASKQDPALQQLKLDTRSFLRQQR